MRQARAAFTLMEVLVTGAIAATLAFPIVGSLFMAGHEAASSEDAMIAEAMAERYLQEALAEPFEALDGKLPLKVSLSGLPGADRGLADGHPELVQNVSGPEAPSGDLHILAMTPDLLRYRITLSWPVRSGSSARRTYTLLRYRARMDASFRTSWAFPVRSALPSTDSSGGASTP